MPLLWQGIFPASFCQTDKVQKSLNNDFKWQCLIDNGYYNLQRCYHNWLAIYIYISYIYIYTKILLSACKLWFFYSYLATIQYQFLKNVYIILGWRGENIVWYFFEKKNPWNFQVYNFTLRNCRQNEASLLEISQNNCVTPFGTSKVKK